MFDINDVVVLNVSNSYGVPLRRTEACAKATATEERYVEQRGKQTDDILVVASSFDSTKKPIPWKENWLFSARLFYCFTIFLKSIPELVSSWIK
jgi:hypothetical protein